ncbi:hypothetical protein PCANC_14713 [Puccinia coronata f. sp. avenae]|uniref:Zn(2)-C6 fungal-type domain-containing protein n=1 Tax=Puccinia coronata f. sp. avenae TaxID=200324 RepID=A0A2N5V0P3_9BASI|nr:hypothetical protein PCANC_14713 [Puccinia coronata f. sp. avenae]PLW43517.1 hypothetical protein PCASD_06754 [Puccinia coronata f. sp. avenae]
MDLKEIDYELGMFLESAQADFAQDRSSCQIQSSSTTCASPKREVKGARRVRNACLQCRERKIRCSRTYPCKGCVSRGDGAACDWQGGFPTGNIPIHQKHVADQRRQIGKLKDRLTCAKALLDATVQCNPKLKLDIGPYRGKPAFVLPVPSREEAPSCFSGGSSSRPPDSAPSCMSVFSTSTSTTNSSQGGSHEDITVCSSLSAELQTSIWKERSPSRLFDSRHKTTGYRPLSLLREEDGLAAQGYRPYNASHTISPRALVFKNRLTPGRNPSFLSWDTNFLHSIAPDRRNLHPSVSSNYTAYPENFTLDAYSSHQSIAPLQESISSASHQIPSASSFPPTGINWPLSGLKSGLCAQSHEHQHGIPSEVESESPITPSRHSQDFSLPYIASLRELPSSGSRNTCQHYLPQRQHYSAQDVEPAAHAFNFRSLPWTGELSPNLEQRIPANVALSLMNTEQYGFSSSALNLAPATGTFQEPTTYNLDMASNWPPFPQ